jgi:hypothetical protein
MPAHSGNDNEIIFAVQQRPRLARIKIKRGILPSKIMFICKPILSTKSAIIS